MRTLTQVSPENVWYNFEDEVDFSQYEDVMVIAGNRDFQSFGKDDYIKVIKGDYYDDDIHLVVNKDGTCYEDTICYDYETAEELAKLSGISGWVEGEFKGYSQGDWQTIWYVKGKVSLDELKYMEAFYMGKMSEFVDDDEIHYFIPDELVWKGKKEICDYIGMDPTDTEVYDDSGNLID